MSKLRKIFTLSVMLVTILSMSIVVVPEVGAAATAGDLIKMDGLSSIYYLGADGKRYVFPNEATYFSWYGDFSGVVTIPQSELESYALGSNVTMRAGTKLVKITTDPKVYAVQPDGKLLWVSSEATATTLYGANWAKRVVDIPDAFFTNYTVLTGEVSASAYPAGSLVKFSGADVYYINADGTASKVANEAAFLANRFKWNDVITATIAMPAAGADITGADAKLIDTSEGGGAGTGITPGAGTGLTVALASDTPAAGTTLSDSDNDGTNPEDGSQALIPVTKVNFTAAADGAVKVNTLKFKRAGVPSSDADFAEYYLYDGNTLLAKYNSVSEGVLTFTNASGLFTVPAGATKSITLKVNLDNGVASSRAYNFSVLSASDVTTDGAIVSGSFPMTGNTMTTAEVSDLGKLTVDTTGTVSAPDPGSTDNTIWSFTLASDAQKINVEKLKFTIIGTVDATDMTNFKLNVAGAQIGSTVASMAADKTVTFDLSASPYQLDKGITKTVNLTADVVSGTNRTFQVYFYNKEDIVAKDMEYGVYITPNQANTFAKVSVGSDATISTGSLTVSKNTASASGNVALGSTGVEIGKFDFKAVGEAIKVNSVYIYTNDSTSSGLRQVKLFVDGTQIGTAKDLVETTATEVACGNSLIIPAGTTKTVVVKADIKESDGTAMTSGETISFQLGNVKSSDYTRQLTGTTGTTGAISANVLTVKDGTLSAAENTSFGDRSATMPTGVVNATGVKIASFTVTAGAGEPVTITQLALADYDTTSAMGKNFQNMKLMHGTTQLGTTKGNLNTTAGTYAFNPSPAIKLGAGQQYVVDVYADIKSSVADAGTVLHGIKFASVSATGDVTNSTADYNPNDFELQNMYIASVGNLNVSDDANTPVAQQLVMGATDQEIAKFKLEASTSENIDITQLTISDTVSAAATGTLQNISIWDGATKVAGPVQLETVASTNHANATFTGFNLTIPAGGSKTLTVKADVTTAANGGVSGSTHTFGILVDDGVVGETIVAKGAQSGTVLTDTDNTIDYYSKTDTPATDADQTGSQMTAYRTKISAAWASDTPSGASVGSSAQTIAKINITNSANDGGYTAIIKNLNLALSTTISNTANRTLTIYKDNLSTTALGSTTWLASLNQNFADTVMVDGDMTDVEIAAGETKTFLFTLDTTNANATGDFSLSVNMAAGDIAWDDSAGTTITTVNSLPLIAKTLTY